MSMTVTVVVTVNDALFDKTKLATATNGQQGTMHDVGRITRRAVRQSLGDTVARSVDVVLTSVTVA